MGCVMSDNRLDAFYYRLDAVDESKRVCPHCGSDDVKYATHDFSRRGFDVSVMCRGCGKDETAISPKYRDIIKNWHRDS